MLKSLIEAKNRTIQPSSLWRWTKRNMNKVFLCFLSVPCTSWAAQRPHSHLCASRESVVHLVPPFPTISLCHFSFLHPSLGIFPTTQPKHKIPALFSTSQRVPEAARCTHTVLSCTLVSSRLPQMLALLHWWPPCWPRGLPERALGSQLPLVSMGLPAELASGCSLCSPAPFAR